MKVADIETKSPTARKYSIPITDVDMAGTPASKTFSLLQRGAVSRDL